MNYPDNYQTPAFPAGGRIAVSRAAAIFASVTMLLILFVCGVLVWSARSRHVEPFLVMTSPTQTQWRIIGLNGTSRTISYVRALQESVIGKFVQFRFHISGDAKTNEILWQPCNATTDCASAGTGRCALYCSATPNVFSDFTAYVVPDYRARANAGERWNVDMESIHITPAGKITDAGGMWRIQATIISNIADAIDVVAYARVARDINLHPRTFGYYIADFNAYRMD